ncbi:MAG: hypothetical protein JXR05_12060 [Flavobacteriaceae bacterium]
MKYLKKHAIRFLAISFFFLALSSCYSVRLVSIKGAPQPNPYSERDDKYENLQVVELDTIIKLNITTGSFDYLIKENKLCKSGKLHSVEYRSTLGGVLLSAITLGTRRKMKVKYVCMKVER